MSNFSVKDIRGVIPAMVTPFDENEALDLARTRAHLRQISASEER